jgi:hypothetical protein
MAGVWHDGEAQRRGRRTRRRGCRSTAAAWLLHLAPTAAPTAAGIFQNTAARACSTSDISEGERKKEERGSVAAEGCFSTASNGSFYRRGRERELGFPEVAGAGKFSGRGGSVDDVRSRGRVVGDAAPPRACWRRSLTSATVSSRAL